MARRHLCLRLAALVPLALSVSQGPAAEVALLVPSGSGHMDAGSTVPSDLGYSLNESVALARKLDAGEYHSTTVVSLCTSVETLWGVICKAAHANFKLYTERHGYGLRFYQTYLTSRSVEWGKVAALYDALTHEDVAYAFWMDADSLFMNMATSLQHLEPRNGKGVSFSPDEGCFLNSGHMMFDASSELGRSFLIDTWWTYPPPGTEDSDGTIHTDIYVEQASMIYLLGGSKNGCREVVNKESCGYSYSSNNSHHEPCSCCKMNTVLGSNVPKYFERLVDLREQRAMGATVMSDLDEEKNMVGAKYRAGDQVLHFEGLQTSMKAACMLTYALFAEALMASGKEGEATKKMSHNEVKQFIQHHVHNKRNETDLTKLAQTRYAGDMEKQYDGDTYWIEAEKSCTLYNQGKYAP